MRRLLVSFSGYALLWALLTGGSPGSWLIGGPAAALATAAGAYLSRNASNFQPWAALTRFLPFFIYQSLRGAWDVARRAVSPNLPIQPGRFRYPCHLPPGPARVFFTAVVSLQPGTLFVADHGTELELHTVALDQPWQRELGHMEHRVTLAFGLAEGSR